MELKPRRVAPTAASRMIVAMNVRLPRHYRPPGSMRAAILIALVLGGLLSATEHAQSSPGAHVHGQARLDLTIEGRTLRIEAELPMETLTGFERAPRTDDERRRLDRALEAVRSATLFRPSADAGCKPTTQTFRWSGPLDSAPGTTTLPADESHTDLLLTHEFDCERPARLGSIDIGLFDAFSRLRRIDARVAGQTGTQARTLQRSRRVLEVAR